MLSLGLIAAFSTSAMAVDVKFNGEYYAAGMYLDKTSLQKNIGPSTAFYFQRLRLGTEFVVSPGLKLVARADIMERAWGAARSAPAGGVGAADIQSAGTRAENENIAFDLMYVNYTSPIGLFFVGYQREGLWGTVFGNTEQPTPKIMYVLPVGGFQLGLYAGKNPDGEKSNGAWNTVATTTNAADRDSNFYTGFVKYAWKNGQAGFLFKHTRDAGNRNKTPLTPEGLLGYTTEAYIATPFVEAKLGPVALQAELYYAFGKYARFEGPLASTQQDISISQLTAWIDATADFGKAYVGGSAAYVQGDDPGSTDKLEGGALDGGREWKPCLIMFNSDLNYWVGTQAGYGTASNGGAMTNAYFAQLRAGVRPIDKLDIMMSVSYATADQKPSSTWLNKEYGWEVDVTAQYKISNNLSYMLGGGYWVVGDYYKATSNANDLQNNLMVINKLSLTF